jgi:hypothetical protein
LKESHHADRAEFCTTTTTTTTTAPPAPLSLRRKLAPFTNELH